MSEALESLMPSALIDDIASGDVTYAPSTYEPANVNIEHKFVPAVRHDGTVWVYFHDDIVDEIGEIARQVSA